MFQGNMFVSYCIVHIICRFQTRWFYDWIMPFHCTRISQEVLQQCFLKYSAFYPLPITAIVFIHRPIFQPDIWPRSSPILVLFGAFASSASTAILDVFGLIETTSRGRFNQTRNDYVSTMIRAMHCQMWTGTSGFITKHVSYLGLV